MPAAPETVHCSTLVRASLHPSMSGRCNLVCQFEPVPQIKQGHKLMVGITLITLSPLHCLRYLGPGLLQVQRRLSTHTQHLHCLANRCCARTRLAMHRLWRFYQAPRQAWGSTLTSVHSWRATCHRVKAWSTHTPDCTIHTWEHMPGLQTHTCRACRTPRSRTLTLLCCRLHAMSALVKHRSDSC